MLAGRLSPLRHAMRRGSARLLVLNVLSSRPMHGYEIAKEISNAFGGGYEPSPGVIYPTLHSLEDHELARGERKDGKTVYTITEKGADLLKKQADVVESLLRLARGTQRETDFPLRRSAARLERTIVVRLPDMSATQRRAIAAMLEETADRVERLMAQ